MEKVYHALIAGTVTPDEKGVSENLKVLRTAVQLFTVVRAEVYMTPLPDSNTGANCLSSSLRALASGAFFSCVARRVECGMTNR